MNDEEKWWFGAQLLRPMLQCLSDLDNTSARKLRLFGVACCRRVWSQLTDERSRQAVEVAERHADGLVEAAALAPAVEAASVALRDICDAKGHDVEWVLRKRPVIFDRSNPAVIRWAIAAACTATQEAHRAATVAESVANMKELAANCGLLRDIFGNPFRPVVFDAAWRTSDVMALANGIYTERAFDRMPILADALQDAGCDSDEILSHLRGNGPHVRGCWALDLVLGKE